MRKPCVCALLLCVPACLPAQSYPGYRTSNYSGANAVFFNPANITDNRYKWNLNLFSVDGYAGNNQQGLNYSDAFDADFNKDTLKYKLLSGTSPGLNALGRMDMIGPTAKYDITPGFTVGALTRSRIFSNAREIDGRLVNAVIDGSPGSADYPFNFNMESALIHTASWNEVGLAAAMVLSPKNTRHFYKAGITAKYLWGVADTYLRLEDFVGTAGYGTRGTYITNATGRIRMHTTDKNFAGFTFGDLNDFNGDGLGADLGIVYEFRPGYDYSRHKDDLFANKYKFKAGIALLDLGFIRFNRKGNQSAAYNMSIADGQQYTLARFRTRSVKDYKQFFDSSPQFTATEDNADTYTIVLPLTLNAEMDYRLREDLYVHLSGQFDLNQSDNLNLFAFNSYMLTPRFENEKFTFALPLNYNEVTKFNAGFSFRAGPFFIGSGSLFTALFDSKQADIHIGFHYGIRYKKTPRPDRDKDGFYDDVDACPLDSGLARYQGCPIPDGDRDGVPDDEDSCVTIAGVAEYHGCPPPRKTDSIEYREEIIDTASTKPDTLTVHFPTGKAVLEEDAVLELLRAARASFERSPGIELYIDGHTDNTGTDAVNDRLSGNRARVVADILRESGIPGSAITVRYFGSRFPRCDNETETGRACNRRVEITRKR